GGTHLVEGKHELTDLLLDLAAGDTRLTGQIHQGLEDRRSDANHLLGFTFFTPGVVAGRCRLQATVGAGKRNYLGSGLRLDTDGFSTDLRLGCLSRHFRAPASHTMGLPHRVHALNQKIETAQKLGERGVVTTGYCL